MGQQETKPKPEPPPAEHFDYEKYLAELDAVGRWRLDRFCDLGFGEAVALILATVNPPADWHRAEDLLARGMSHRQVAREFI